MWHTIEVSQSATPATPGGDVLDHVDARGPMAVDWGLNSRWTAAVLALVLCLADVPCST